MPQPDEGTKRAQKGERNRLSRREMRVRDGAGIVLPPNPAPHIVERLIEIGLTEAAGMGSGPLSWQEIHAWQCMTGAGLSPFEARLIRRLSTEYVAFGRKAEDENCPPPWHAPVTDRERELAEAKLRMVLG